MEHKYSEAMTPYYLNQIVMKKSTIALCAILLPLISLVAIADGSQTQLLEERYAQQGDVVWEANYELCKIERKLAQSKLSDFDKGIADYKQTELNRLAQKGSKLCGNETEASVIIPQNKVVSTNTQSGYDLDCLADSVAVAETSYCQAGAGLTRNNCFGIMMWDRDGVRHLKSYPTNEDSFADFKRIWSKHYDTYPVMSTAIKWTGNDNARTWLTAVNSSYNRCTVRKLDL